MPIFSTSQKYTITSHLKFLASTQACLIPKMKIHMTIAALSLAHYEQFRSEVGGRSLHAELGLFSCHALARVRIRVFGFCFPAPSFINIFLPWSSSRQLWNFFFYFW